MQRFSKRPIILMELLVALVLIGTILSLLFKFFSNTMKMDHKIDAIRHETFAREHLQIRLLHLFSSIIPKSTLPDISNASLYSLDSEFPGLAAIFDNGIDPDPRFSGAVLGEIYLDQGQLFLSLHPFSDAGKDTCRREFLLQHVEKLEFQFLSRPSEKQPKMEWIKSWPKTRWDIPSIIRVVIKRNKDELGFAFSLPFADPITFERKQT